MEETKGDMINHPGHYKHGSMETIDIIKAVTNEGYESYLVGNIIKYISRYKYKNGAEDLKKASVYLGFLIAEQPIKAKPFTTLQPVKYDDIEYVDAKGKTQKLQLG